MSALVLEADSKKIRAIRQNGETLEITGDGLKPAQSGLSDKAPPNIKIRRGAVIRVAKTLKNTWEITQLPEVEGAFVALDPRDGSIKAMVGGFDFEKNKFNHVMQAWRQPGSSFKPFIYSAALEKGLTPATVINDAPLFFDAGVTGGQPWEPKNYDGKFEGPMTMRRGLAKSKNMISIRILQAVGAQNAQEWITRFGFDQDKHPCLSDDGTWRWIGDTLANGLCLLGLCQWRLPHQSMAHQQSYRAERQGTGGNDTARIG
jgi:penicillin-binding protein 1A